MRIILGRLTGFEASDKRQEGRVRRGYVDLQSVANVWRVCHRSINVMPQWQVLETLHSHEFHTVVRALTDDSVEVILRLYSPAPSVWIVEEIAGRVRTVWVAKTTD